jgi:trk system potassium uptake protein TrkA
MRIVIAGCGRVGSDLAHRLDAERHTVAVIDIEAASFRSLGPEFAGSTHVGLAYDVEILRESGIEDADAFGAATGSDNVNAIAVQIVRQAFGVATAVARLNDPHREETYRLLDIGFVSDAAECSEAIHESLLAGGSTPTRAAPYDQHSRRHRWQAG